MILMAKAPDEDFHRVGTLLVRVLQACREHCNVPDYQHFLFVCHHDDHDHQNLPPEVLQISSVVAIKTNQLLGQRLGRWEVHHVEVGPGHRHHEDAGDGDDAGGDGDHLGGANAE